MQGTQADTCIVQLCRMPEALRNQEFQCANVEILGNTDSQSSNIQGQAGQPHSHRSYSKISGSTSSYQPNINASSQFSRVNQNHNGDHRRNTSSSAGRQHPNQSNLHFRNHGYNQQRGAQFHARFDERYNQQYSSPIYPPTPSLNSSF